MDHRYFETYLSVLRLGGISKSAARLNLTQSATSRRIQSLEEELDVKLFVPKGRGIEPTELALRLVPHAEAVVDAVERFRQAANPEKNLPIKLRVAATPQTIAATIAPLIPDLAASGVALSLIEAGGADIEDLVRQDVCDCGISSIPTFESGLQSKRLSPLHLHAYGSPRWDKSAKEHINLSELSEENLLLFTPDFQSRKIVDGAFQLMGQRPNIVYEGHSSLAILALASADVGVAILPSNIKSACSGPRVLFNNDPLSLDVTLIWRPSSRRMDGIEAFFAKLSANHL